MIDFPFCGKAAFTIYVLRHRKEKALSTLLFSLRYGGGAWHCGAKNVREGNRRVLIFHELFTWYADTH